jgi:hypothetical protein
MSKGDDYNLVLAFIEDNRIGERSQENSPGVFRLPLGTGLLGKIAERIRSTA